MLARVLLVAVALGAASSGAAQPLPRTADGKPDLSGIWQVRNRASYDLELHAARDGLPAGESVVVGGEIPYLPAALEQKRKNFAARLTADPFRKCFLPGVPRIMYLEYPFQIFQTPEHIAIAFEWSQVYRLIYTNGKPTKHEGIESWMGNSRGRWEGDVLVVQVTGMNGETWLDASGNFHSDALEVTERYRLRDANTIDYEATLEDPKVFARPWKIGMQLHRQTEATRIFEYQCQAEAEEASGAFERDERTWYPAPPPADNAPFDARAGATLRPLAVPRDIARLPDGKPSIEGWYQPDAGGANYGLETRKQNFLTPESRGIVVDPADGSLPYQRWARAERENRALPHRGYDDPTAHCFVAGVPRSQYVPAPVQILQPPGYVVMLFERMSWRIIPLDGRAHLPDRIRLWQGDSVGQWDGDTLVVETRNSNGKAWLNEVGDVITHAATVVERYTPVAANRVIYRATVSDPIAYTRPWTIEVPLDRQDDELLEVACHEDNGDLEHLKDVRDEFRAKQRQGN
ncbi:MAG TPA: hypothetical protein VFO94_19020 [Gammaproteobacteria bacterium]|nr:hypothetical protein [Gammaproteobacteria bacterium]